MRSVRPLSVVVMLMAYSSSTSAAEPASNLTVEQASAFAKLALKNIDQEFPHKLGVVWEKAEDVKPPRQVHPTFFGSFDWHSCVHGHWMLVRVLKLHPQLPEAKAIRAVLNDHFSKEKLQAEADYFGKKEGKSFERPYGWAWLLKLAAELHTWKDDDAKTWSAHLTPLAEIIAKRYIEYFPKQTYPIRSGVHSNTAFGLTFALDYATTVNNTKLKDAIVDRAKSYYGKDTDAPARWEPDGADFLSPSLCEADLMRRVLPPAEFSDWLTKYLPGLAKAEPATLFTPAIVTDRSDPYLVHLDGLNLSRGWCLKGIAGALPKDDPRQKLLLQSATKHTEAALKHVTSGDYAGEHWLASFAVYLLSAE
jgi:hypothetical protein